LESRAGAEAPPERADPALDRPQADAEVAGDGLVGEAGREECEQGAIGVARCLRGGARAAPVALEGLLEGVEDRRAADEDRAVDLVGAVHRDEGPAPVDDQLDKGPILLITDPSLNTVNRDNPFHTAGTAT
jgi:hypothetical protein